MNKEYFIQELKRLRDSCIQSLIQNLEQPPGRKPARMLREVSDFYNCLDKEQKYEISKIILYSVDKVLFSFLCILDHVRFIEDSEEKSTFELYAIKNGEKILINDPKQEEMHNLYNSLTLDQDR